MYNMYVQCTCCTCTGTNVCLWVCVNVQLLHVHDSFSVGEVDTDGEESNHTYDEIPTWKSCGSYMYCTVYSGRRNHVCMTYVWPYTSSFTKFYVCIMCLSCFWNVKLSTPNRFVYFAHPVHAESTTACAQIETVLHSFALLQLAWVAGPTMTRFFNVLHLHVHVHVATRAASAAAIRKLA